ncbi:MAG TPA: hypothetical protein VLA49_02145 [Anaerolineales bacterium]|nr:hypothetical protein [Anaerolineales bacterium]
MRTGTGLVSEVRVDESGHFSAWVRCEPEIRPAPGQYALARSPLEREAVLARPLFAGEYSEDGFLALGTETSWGPGTEIELRGPLGRGFQLPASTRRLALVAYRQTAERLLPLASLALAQGAAVVLYCEPLPRRLPLSLEAFPLAVLPEALPWADFLAAEAPLTVLEELAQLLGFQEGMKHSLAGEVLVDTAMPCGGAADCGACALPTRNGWKLACKDGPVFDLQALDWQKVGDKAEG